MKKSWILPFGIFLSLCFTMMAWAGVSEMADSLIKAYAEKQPPPILSPANPNLDVKTAYQVQKAYVQWRMTKDKVADFKAGLTTEGAQKAFGVTFPLAGVLYNSGKLDGSPVVDGKALPGVAI